MRVAFARVCQRLERLSIRRYGKIIRTRAPLVVVVFLSLLLAAGASARTETKVRLALYPCIELGDEDAGGEVEYEGEEDKATLKVEVWGATKLIGTAVHVFVDGKLLLTFDVEDELARLTADVVQRVDASAIRVIISRDEAGDSPVLSDRPC